MKQQVRFLIRAFTIATLLSFLYTNHYAQELIAYWNFNTGANGTPWNAPISASNGSGTITAGTWTWGDITYTDGFAGSTQNALFGDDAGASLSLKSEVMNGNYIQFEFSMDGYENLEISYWTRRTGTGFDNNQWSWSSDGVNFTNFGDPIDPTSLSSGEVIIVNAPTQLNGTVNVYLRYTLNGATSGSGNNRIDNFQLNAFQPGAVLPPANLEAEAISTTQINLSWDQNASNDDVLLAWSHDGIFGDPTGTYNPGDPISGGGTVLSLGANTTYNHQSLTPGTTYYYKAWSKSGSDYSTGITANEATMPDPATTTLPYSEDFENDLGDCYVYSVAGDSKYWIHSSSNETAQMNGHNSGELEEDWLIIPGINFNNYVNEIMTFDTWWRYGEDDANNYLKLFYSTNYPGTEDPTPYNWIELSFIQPAVEQTWVSSGNIDLSGISGDMVYIGFKYRYEPGKYKWWQVDNISITGTPIGTQAVKLSISDVNSGNSPSVNTGFPVTVVALDDDDQPAAVSADTQVTLSLASGSGSLGGNLTGTITEGQTTVTIDGVTYNIAESGVSITASATGLLPGTSDLFTVLAAANHLAFVDVAAFAQVNSPIPAFTVEARRADNSVDLNFTGSITISKASGPGTMAGTLEKSAVAGVATFDDVEFSEAGTYTMQAASAGLTGATSPNIVILGEPQISADILPEFMMGNSPSNNRLPFAYRATLSNLIPNATYKYTNQAVVAADGPTVAGAGNAIYVTSSGDFIRSTGTSFTNPEQHYEFVTDENGSFTGWFVTEPTGNARFTAGNEVFMRIRLNDGDGGTTPVSYLTITDPVSVLMLGPDNEPLYASGVYGKHFSQGKNFAVLYDNADGTGRALTATFIEDDGTSGGTAYPGFYQDHVDGQEGSWGALIPNQLPQGLRRVEVRDRITGIIIDGTATTSDGIWPYGSNTVNPSTGTTGILITPWPDFVADDTNVSPGTDISFTDLTPGTPNAWDWEFIGGTPGSSTLQNPVVTYYNTGEFDVSMTVTTEFGTETITKVNYINVNELPWPDFSAEPTMVAVDSAVVFTDLSTGNPDTWEWTFEGGDPATYSGQEPPPVTYSAPGSYDVTLVVSNEWGSNTMVKENYITAGFAPVADFEGNPTSIIEGEPVEFTDLSDNDPDSWEWMFEEGTPSTSILQNPVVVFNTPGSFNVTLTATNAFGTSTITKEDYIFVEPVGIGTPVSLQHNIRPNPSEGVVTIQILPGTSLRVYNTSGQIVFETKTEGTLTKIDLSAYGKGLYIIECIHEEGRSLNRSKLIIR